MSNYDPGELSRKRNAMQVINCEKQATLIVHIDEASSILGYDLQLELEDIYGLWAWHPGMG